MSYRYFALLDSRDGGDPTQVSDVQEIALRELGLRSCLDSSRVHLFVSEGTPVLVLSNGRVLIGHLFDRSGRPVRNGSDLLESRSDAQFTEHLLQNYWGEYIVICHAGDRAHELTILREPSGGMPAIHAVQEGTGFVTSDISIAIKLGLYTRQIDWNYITTFLAFPHLKTATTALDGVRELPPGCSLRLRGTQATIQVCWSPWDFVTSRKRFREQREAADAIRATVLSVVKAWADADRTVLLELSGGARLVDRGSVLAGHGCTRDVLYANHDRTRHR